MKFVCPVHAEITSNKKGLCDICGMRLVRESQIKNRDADLARPPEYAEDLIPWNPAVLP